MLSKSQTFKLFCYNPVGRFVTVVSTANVHKRPVGLKLVEATAEYFKKCLTKPIDYTS